MKNAFLDARSAADIDAIAKKIHADLDYRDGAVSLDEVRDLLRLDRKYYNPEDPDLLDEVIHKLKRGAMQIVMRPMLLLEAIKKHDLRALYFPDKKRILIDANIPELKKRWSESHEISHSFIPWHQEFMLGDDKETLSPQCSQQIEAEANYGSGRLIFPQAVFHTACRSAAIDIAYIRQLAKQFGNTITSTLWRSVEDSDDLLFALVCDHPIHADPSALPVTHFVESRSFSKQFKGASIAEIYGFLKTFCAARKSGPLGEAELLLSDTNGDRHVFHVECFSVTHNTLVLGTWRRIQSGRVFVPTEIAL